MAQSTDAAEGQPELRQLDEHAPAVHAHLAMLQGVIERMATNSRSCKVWCVTLTAAVLVLVARTGEPRHAFIALVPILLFWGLDAYYLALERRHRQTYDGFVEKLHERAELFPILFTVKPTGSWIPHFVNRLRSPSTWPFYLVMLATMLLAWQVIL